MASHSSATLCRYYASGCCNRENCPFSHDRSGSARPDNVCRYYLQGSCFYGDSCRYDHVNPNRPRHHAAPGSQITSKANQTGVIPKGRMVYPGHVSTKDDEKEKKESPSSVVPHHAPPTSYAQAVDSTVPVFSEGLGSKKALCQYAMTGICQVESTCEFRHGDLCEMCSCQVLDREDPVERARHEKECSAAFERDMEFSFAMQRSAQKACTICLEVVLEQTDLQRQRFGVLENCGHTFCFDCIMKWRKQSRESLDKNAIRSCPECRVHSDYVIPSTIWPETKEQKDAVISQFKTVMRKKPCRNFDNGKGTCPFGGKCWFLHALPDGTKVDLPDPKPRRRVEGAGLSYLLPSSYALMEFLEGQLSDEDDDDEEDFYDGFDEYMEYDSDDSDRYIAMSIRNPTQRAFFREMSRFVHHHPELVEDHVDEDEWTDTDPEPSRSTSAVDAVIEDIATFFERNTEPYETGEEVNAAP